MTAAADLAGPAQRGPREEHTPTRTLQEEAATAWREAALALRAEGLSVADAATIMGVSRGRISQLTA